MASNKEIPLKKKGKNIQTTRTIKCYRCNRVTTHTLYDAENKIYKCNICGSVVKL